MSSADQAVALDEPFEVFSPEDVGAMRRLYAEASNLLCLLTDDEASNIKWGYERKGIGEALKEAKKVLW